MLLGIYHKEIICQLYKEVCTRMWFAVLIFFLNPQQRVCLEREGGGKRRREGEKEKHRYERHIDCLPPTCALTWVRNRACQRGKCPWPESNPGRFSPRAKPLTTEQNCLESFAKFFTFVSPLPSINYQALSKIWMKIKIWEHVLYLQGFILWCSLRLEQWLNALPNNLHFYCYTPAWIPQCWAILEHRLKAMPHSLHFYGIFWLRYYCWLKALVPTLDL